MTSGNASMAVPAPPRRSIASTGVGMQPQIVTPQLCIETIRILQRRGCASYVSQGGVDGRVTIPGIILHAQLGRQVRRDPWAVIYRL